MFRRRARTLAVELFIKEIWSLNRVYKTEKNNTIRRNRDATLSRPEFDLSIFIAMVKSIGSMKILIKKEREERIKLNPLSV
jgi:hypothetical protein